MPRRLQGEKKRLVNGGILACSKNGKGYRNVRIGDDLGSVRTMKVHRLVALTFLPRPTDLDAVEVNHINGNKSDNRAENLEWVTRTQNIRHALRSGIVIPKRGEDHARAKLTAPQVEDIRSRLAKGEGPKAISADYPVGENQIQHIAHGRRWT